MTDQLCHLCLAGPGEIKTKGYGFCVCPVCWQAAERGWPKRFEPTIFAALAKAGLLIPDREASGQLPRDYQPPADFDL